MLDHIKSPVSLAKGSQVEGEAKECRAAALSLVQCGTRRHTVPKSHCRNMHPEKMPWEASRTLCMWDSPQEETFVPFCPRDSPFSHRKSDSWVAGAFEGSGGCSPAGCYGAGGIIQAVQSVREEISQSHTFLHAWTLMLGWGASLYHMVKRSKTGRDQRNDILHSAPPPMGLWFSLPKKGHGFQFSSFGRLLKSELFKQAFTLVWMWFVF